MHGFTPGAWRIACGRGAPQMMPLGLARAEASLVGLTCDRALNLTGLLHALCPHAHRVALSRAIESAAGRDVDEAVESKREHIVAAEAAAAAAFRFGVTWPQAFGAHIDPALPHLRAQAHGVIEALESGGDATGPAHALGAALLAMLAPNAAIHSLRARFAPLHGYADAACAGPRLLDRVDGMIADARERAHFWNTFEEARPLLPSRVNSGGIGRVQTLRGLLSVEVSVEDDKLSACRIEAPIDRLTHAHGPLARALHNCRDLNLARLIVLAFDPCAAMEIVALEEGRAAYA